MYEFNAFSLVDAPGPCALIFSRGCNLSCKYCYNIDLLDTSKGLTYNEVLTNINNLISTNPKGEQYSTVPWIILSGGEPLSQTNSIDNNINILEYSKKLNLKTGIYSNSFFNLHLMDIIQEGLVDFVNLDFKHTDLNIVLNNDIKSNYLKKFKSALETAYVEYSNSNLEYLFINTVVCKSFHNKEIILSMKKEITEIIPDIPILFNRNYSKNKIGWVITPFFNDHNKIPTLGNLDYDTEKYSEQELKELLI
jgi:pyruvate-formate lyase-activating enzyme